MAAMGSIGRVLLEAAKIAAIGVILVCAAALLLGGLALADECARNRLRWYRTWALRARLRRLRVGTVVYQFPACDSCVEMLLVDLSRALSAEVVGVRRRGICRGVESTPPFRDEVEYLSVWYVSGWNRARSRRNEQL